MVGHYEQQRQNLQAGIACLENLYFLGSSSPTFRLAYEIVLKGPRLSLMGQRKREIKNKKLIYPNTFRILSTHFNPNDVPIALMDRGHAIYGKTGFPRRHLLKLTQDGSTVFFSSNKPIANLHYVEITGASKASKHFDVDLHFGYICAERRKSSFLDPIFGKDFKRLSCASASKKRQRSRKSAISGVITVWWSYTPLEEWLF